MLVSIVVASAIVSPALAWNDRGHLLAAMAAYRMADVLNAELSTKSQTTKPTETAR